MSLINQFKKKLLKGETQVGLWAALASPYCAEICAGAGFNWLLLDGEHAPNDIRSLLAQLQAVAPYDVAPVVRPPVSDTTLVKQYLDIGAQNLLLPMIEDAEQANIAVRATRYPPQGMRGVGSGLARAARWSRVPHYLQEADGQICVLVQVESRKGIENLAAIAEVPGVDGVFLGPSDLAAAYGHIGQTAHPEVTAIIERAIADIRRAGKAVGILAVDEAVARRYIELGCSFIAVGTDVGLLARGAERLAQSFPATRGSQ
ncbi:MAG: 4-hydroxy-2-oxoheptanedioate aldolase [Polycyclovorans sp.]|nr:4-hydroxy-2-oxoheptanedioate aldolase [Polycyclovorans sp.]